MAETLKDAATWLREFFDAAERRAKNTRPTKRRPDLSQVREPVLLNTDQRSQTYEKCVGQLSEKDRDELVRMIREMRRVFGPSEEADV